MSKKKSEIDEEEKLLSNETDLATWNQSRIIESVQNKSTDLKKDNLKIDSWSVYK